MDLSYEFLIFQRRINQEGFFFAFLRFLNLITSCCLSPSTSANFRLISEYLSCISLSSSSISLFLSFSFVISQTNSSSFVESSTRDFVSFSDASSCLLSVQDNENQQVIKEVNRKDFILEDVLI